MKVLLAIEETCCTIKSMLSYLKTKLLVSVLYKFVKKFLNVEDC